MKKTLMVAVLALLPVVASANPPAVPAAAAAGAPTAQALLDMRYSYDENDSSLMRDYDGEPWWVMLANCAGYHIAASEQQGFPQEQVAALKSAGNYFATLASLRYAKDNGRAPDIQPEVEQLAFRSADNALLNGLVADQRRVASMGALCGAHVNAYERMVPGMLLDVK